VFNLFREKHVTNSKIQTPQKEIFRILLGSEHTLSETLNLLRAMATSSSFRLLLQNAHQQPSKEK
jgi:hypothetical protein